MKLTPNIEMFLENAPINNGARQTELWYLASPYTHDDPITMRDRLIQIRQITQEIIHCEPLKDKIAPRMHVIPFSPVVYTVDLVKGMPKAPVEGWYHFTLGILAKCDRLVVVEMDGWEESFGVNIEIAFAMGDGIPINYLDPKLLLEAS